MFYRYEHYMCISHIALIGAMEHFLKIFGWPRYPSDFLFQIHNNRPEVYMQPKITESVVYRKELTIIIIYIKLCG